MTTAQAVAQPLTNDELVGLALDRVKLACECLTKANATRAVGNGKSAPKSADSVRRNAMHGPIRKERKQRTASNGKTRGQ